MKLEHVAIWTKDIERMKEYYVRFFGGKPNQKYTNASRGFESYFLSFPSGARLELMHQPTIPANTNDTVTAQHRGIIHLAFGADTMIEVDAKAKEIGEAGYTILSGPRITGDGYYEFETLDPEQNRIEVTCKVRDLY
jgi:lactoylglutathione lyase